MILGRSTRSTKSMLYAFVFVTLSPSAVLPLTPEEIFDQVKASVLVVKVYDERGKQTCQGSGVMLPSGEVVTNYHVLKGGTRYEVGSGKDFKAARWTAGDEKKDLGLLKTEGVTAKSARLGQASQLKVGEPVYAIGSPQGLELSISDGIVSQLRGGPPPIIQTTAAISPGSSGGGLFDSKGDLIGITTFYLTEGQSLNFAVPVEWVDKIQTAVLAGAFSDETHKQVLRDLQKYLEACGEYFSHLDPNQFKPAVLIGELVKQAGPKAGAKQILSNINADINDSLHLIDTLLSSSDDLPSALLLYYGVTRFRQRQADFLNPDFWEYKIDRTSTSPFYDYMAVQLIMPSVIDKFFKSYLLELAEIANQALVRENTEFAKKLHDLDKQDPQ